LVDFEYLVVVASDGGKVGQGRTMRYAVTQAPMQSDIAGLLSPVELRARLGGRR
jgi:hypothetical protein